MTHPAGGCDRESSVFRFADLPGELRMDIYRKYLGTWDAVVAYDRSLAAFRVGGLPVFDILFTNRACYEECSHLIAEAFSGRLLLQDTKIRREKGFGFVSSLAVITSLCPVWLLNRTRVLAIERGTTGMLAPLPWERLKLLEEVHLEGSAWPDSHSYPCGMSIMGQAMREKELIEGKYDTWCIHGYNKWSQVPEPVNDGRVKVVTVREGKIKGVSLRVRVKHQADGVEVLDRLVN